MAATVSRILMILLLTSTLVRECRAALPTKSASNELAGTIVVTPTSDRLDSPWLGAGEQVIAESEVTVGHPASLGVKGTVWVDIPAGTVTGGRLRICAITRSSPETPALPSGVQPICTVVRVSLEGGLQTGSLAIALTFDPGGIGSGEEPSVFFRSERSGRWVFLESVVAPGGSTISAWVEHMGVFAVFPCHRLECLSDADGHWAEAEATALAQMDILCGYPDTPLRLDGFVTREEAAVLVARALGLPGSAESTALARDEAWSAGALGQLAKLGLLVGYPDGQLEAGHPLTRAEAAVILTRVIDGGWVRWPETDPGAGVGLSLTEPAWAAPALARMCRAEIIRGYPDGTLRLLDYVTWGELSAMLYRLIATP